MPGRDYYRCDVCGGRTFYEGGLHFDPAWKKRRIDDADLPVGAGDMRVLCLACAEYNEVVVQTRSRGRLTLREQQSYQQALRHGRKEPPRDGT